MARSFFDYIFMRKKTVKEQKAAPVITKDHPEYYLKQENRISRQPALFQIENSIKILNDSANLVNNTVDPGVFFRRYSQVFNQLLQLYDYGRYPGVKGDTLQDFKNTYNNMEAIVGDFIDRATQNEYGKIVVMKTQKGKEKRFFTFCAKMIEAFVNVEDFRVTSIYVHSHYQPPCYTGALFVDASYEYLKCSLQAMANKLGISLEESFELLSSKIK